MNVEDEHVERFEYGVRFLVPHKNAGEAVCQPDLVYAVRLAAHLPSMSEVVVRRLGALDSRRGWREMSADLLRRAAALMRERAEAATPGPWVVFDMDEAEHHKDEPLNDPGMGWYWVWAAPNLPFYGGVLRPERDHPEAIIGSAAIDDSSGGKQEQADAEHVASWHPAVALAVASWLEYEAKRLDLLDREEMHNAFQHNTKMAVEVARLYLGEAE